MRRDLRASVLEGKIREWLGIVVHLAAIEAIADWLKGEGLSRKH